jgi:8-oxo-dGTP diphosphatase
MSVGQRAPHRGLPLVKPSARSAPELGPQRDSAPTLVSVGWVHISDRQLLAVRSTTSDRFFLPGGKPEPGETLEEALEREVLEELGIRILEAEHLFTVTAPAYGLLPSTALIMHCYGGNPRGRPKPLREIAELAWLGCDDERAAPAVRRVLTRLNAAGLVS